MYYPADTAYNISLFVSRLEEQSAKLLRVETATSNYLLTTCTLRMSETKQFHEHSQHKNI